MNEEKIQLDKDIARIKSLFVNREDVHARQFITKEKKKGFRLVKEKITSEKIKHHIEGKDFLGVYQLDNNSYVKWGCLDFDENTKEDFDNAKKIYDFLNKKGFHPLPEKSGGGDYKVHIWIFSNDPIPAKQMKDFLEWVCEKTGVQPHENFPKQTKIDKGGYGNLLKLPFGTHLGTFRKSLMLDDDFKEIRSEKQFSNKLEFHFDNKDLIPITEGLLNKNQENKDNTEKENEQQSQEAPKNWDEFMNYVLNHELPKGIEKGAKIGQKEAGVNNNILKNVALWLFQKGYTEEKLKQEIQPLMKEKGRSNSSFNNLKGWFKKAQKGDIKEIAKGELIKWCQEYQPSLLNYIPEGIPYLKPEDIEFKTDHLPKFDLIHEIIPLQGKQYDLFKKGAYYLLVSLAVPNEKLNIRVGNIETDLREHNIVVVPSGKGKLDYKEGVKETLKEFNSEAKIKEPRSLHNERLIGKVLKRKEKNPNTNKQETKIYKKYGDIFSDLLILEEGHELLNSREKNEVDMRDTLTVGLDTYGKNIVSKNNIDDLDVPEETIEGYPKNRTLFFLQPLVLNQEFTTKGLHRRGEVQFQEFPERTNADLFVNRLNAKPKDKESRKNFAEFMKEIKNVQGEWKFSSEAFEVFIKCHLALLEQGFCKGGNARHFAKIMEFPMQNKLLKKSALNSIANLRTTIRKEDVEHAFIDLLEQFTFELQFVEKLVSGSLDYGLGWGGATGKKQECLKWLYDMGANSKENSFIKIPRFQQIISQKFDISPRRARDRYNKMKQEGLIEDWIGQKRDSRVWLKITPKIYNEKKPETYNPKEMYFDISLRTQRTPRSPRTPDSQKTENSDRTGQTGRTADSENVQTKELTSHDLVKQKQSKDIDFSELNIKEVSKNG